MAGIGRAGGLSLLAAALGLVPEAIATAHAQATPPVQQQAGADTPAAKPGIRVAPVILAEPDVETAISITVGPEPAIPRQTFLRVRGMPLAAKLSEGHVVTPGIWAVPLSALPNLRLLAPLSSSGRTEIHLSLVSADGSVLAENKSSLVVAPAWLLGSNSPRQDGPRAVPVPRTELAPVATAPLAAAPVAAPVASKPEPVAQPEPPRTVAPLPQFAARQEVPAVVAALPPAPSPPPAATVPAAAPPPALVPVAPAPAARVEPPRAPAPAEAPAAPAAKAPTVLTAADRERAEGMLQRGETFMKQGNLAAARQFFRRGADMGLPAGALRMGSTYDPAELSGLGMVGVQPDPKEAALWYERARELGAPEAALRLSRLQSR